MLFNTKIYCDEMAYTILLSKVIIGSNDENNFEKIIFEMSLSTLHLSSKYVFFILFRLL